MLLLQTRGANAGNSRLSSGFGPNLIVTGKSNFEDTVSVWGTNNSTVANSAVRAHGGSRSLQVTADGGGATLCNLTSANYGGNLDASSVYMLEGWLWLDAGWDGGLTWILMKDYAGSSAVIVKTDTEGAWVKVTAETTLAADVAGQLHLQATNTPTNGKVMYLDDVLLRKMT